MSKLKIYSVILNNDSDRLNTKRLCDFKTSTVKYTFDRIKNVTLFLKSQGITKGVSRRTLNRKLNLKAFNKVHMYVKENRSKKAKNIALILASKVNSFDKVHVKMFNMRKRTRIASDLLNTERVMKNGLILYSKIDELTEGTMPITGYDTFFKKIIDSIEFNPNRIYRIMIEFTSAAFEEMRTNLNDFKIFYIKYRQLVEAKALHKIDKAKYDIILRKQPEERTPEEEVWCKRYDDEESDYYFTVRTVSTFYSNEPNQLYNDLHRLYTSLTIDYGGVTITQYQVDQREIAMGSMEMPVSAGNTEQIKKIMRLINHNNHYTGKYTRLTKLLNGRKLYVPNTYRNCMLKSLYVLTTNKRKMTEKTLSNLVSNMKKHWFNDTRKVLTIKQYFEKIKKLTNWNVRVHNLFNLDDVVEIIQNTDTPVYEILLVGDHACGILPENKNEWSTGLLASENISLISVRDKLFKNPKIDFANSTLTYDFETLVDKNNFPFTVSIYDGTTIYNLYHESEVMDQFFNWLKQYSSKIPPKGILYLYAHNAGKFDSHFILKYIMTHSDCGFSIPQTFVKDGRLISFSTIFNKKHFVFNDSMSLLVGSLDGLTGSRGFNVEHKKQTGSVPFKLMVSTLINDPELKKRIIKYCNYDAMSLYEVLEKFNNIMMAQFNIDIRYRKTAASLAKLVFLKKYYDEETSPIYSLNEDIDQYIRSSYYGGRCDIFNYLGDIPDDVLNGGTEGKNCYYFDATSFYPTQMSTKQLPYGLPIIVKKQEIEEYLNKPNYRGFVKVKVRSIKKSNIPLHGIKYSINHVDKLIFPNFKNFTKTKIYSEELKAGIESGLYEYEYLDAIFFKSNYFYKECTDAVFQLKYQAAINHEPAKKNAFKVILNSLYGFWGIRRYTKSTSISSNKHNLYRALASGTLSNFTKFSERNSWMIEQQTYMSKIESNVGIAAAITAEARVELWKFMKLIETCGGTVLYCDTDSIISNLDTSKRPEFSKYFNEPNQLGGWTNEISDHTEGRVDRSDHLITIGPKFYTLEGFLKLKGFSPRPGKVIIDHTKRTIYIKTIINKLENDALNWTDEQKKIWSTELTLQHYKLLARNYKVSQENYIQFYGSCSSQYYSDQTNKLEVPTKLIIKKFKLVYDKQNIIENNLENDGYAKIYPLNI